MTSNSKTPVDSLIPSKPVQLIFYNESTCSYESNLASLENTIGRSTKPVCVVSIAGKYRTGKSFILNRILGVDHDGFELGHAVQGKTRGIWLWAKEEDDQILVLLDTEGLYDPKQKPETDVKIFALCLLLSSFMMINVVGALDTSTFDHLRLVSQMISTIKTNSIENSNNGEDFYNHFPALTFIVRDFVLSLEDKTPEQWLHECLVEEPTLSEDSEKQLDSDDFRLSENIQKKIRNKVKRQIHQWFPSLGVHCIQPPVNDMKKNLRLIESDPSCIKQDFLDEVDALISKIRATAKHKQIQHNGMVKTVTGIDFISLVREYTDSIINKRIPSIPDAFEAVVAKQSKLVFDHASEKAIESLEALRNKFPLSSEQFDKETIAILDQGIDYICKEAYGNTKLELEKQFRQKFLCRDASCPDSAFGLIPGKYQKENSLLMLDECEKLFNEQTAEIQEKLDNFKYNDYDTAVQELDNVLQELAILFDERGNVASEFLSNKMKDLNAKLSNLGNRLEIDDVKKKNEMLRIEMQETNVMFDLELQKNKEIMLRLKQDMKSLEDSKNIIESSLEVERLKWNNDIQKQREEYQKRIEELKNSGNKQLAEEIRKQREEFEAKFQAQKEQIEKKNQELFKKANSKFAAKKKQMRNKIDKLKNCHKKRKCAIM